MKINLTHCGSCGNRIGAVVVYDYNFACPKCGKTISEEQVKRNLIKNED